MNSFQRPPIRLFLRYRLNEMLKIIIFGSREITQCVSGCKYKERAAGLTAPAASGALFQPGDELLVGSQFSEKAYEGSEFFQILALGSIGLKLKKLREKATYNFTYDSITISLDRNFPPPFPRILCLRLTHPLFPSINIPADSITISFHIHITLL